MSSEIDTQKQHNMRRVALTSLAGTSIEWYDFFLYGTAAAVIFPKAFFPQDLPPMVLLIISFSTFAVGFIARPLGGVVFGHFGDQVGRKRTLVIALMMMGVATTLIGLLPTYQSIGIAAPLMLVALRFIQGLAVGGQWGGAMLLVTESAPSEKRGWYGAYAQAGAAVGVILANLAFLSVSTSMSDEAFIDWGWRLPFIASIGGCITGTGVLGPLRNLTVLSAFYGILCGIGVSTGYMAYFTSSAHISPTIAFGIVCCNPLLAMALDIVRCEFRGVSLTVKVILAMAIVCYSSAIAVLSQIAGDASDTTGSDSSGSSS